MHAALMEHEVSLATFTYRKQVMRAMANGCVGVDPQRSGGRALPSTIEKEIAKSAKHLREQHYPVFPECIIKCAVEAIEGTDHTSYFPDGKPNRGWYRGWLSRVKFLTGAVQSLELTRKEW